MKISIIFLIFATFMVLQAITTLSAEQEMLVVAGSNTTSSLGESGVFLGSSSRSWRRMTCDRHPKVCRKAGSPGRDCCRKRCVNVMKDRANCGRCRNKCRYSEICCKGRCVRPASDRHNCGRCGHRCKRGIACVHGFCSYA